MTTSGKLKGIFNPEFFPGIVPYFFKGGFENQMSDNPLVWRGAVTGLSYHEYGMVISQLRVGVNLELRSVENLYDPSAVGVFLDSHQVGWIPKNQNFEIRSLLDSGMSLTCVITNHTPEGDFSRRLFINVYRPQFEEKVSPRPVKRTIKEIEMSNVTSSSLTSPKATGFFLNLGRSNLSAVKTAGYLEAGRLANKQVTKVLAKRLPIMVRGYADTPFGRLVVANMATVAAAHFRGEDETLGKLTEAMQVQAYQEMLQCLEIETFLDELMENASMKMALKKLKASEERSEE